MDKYLGPVEERKVDMSTEPKKNAVETDVVNWLKFIWKKEPRSNRGIDDFLSQEEKNEA